MKKLLFVFALILFSVNCSAQFVGIGAQWKDFEKGQFTATLSFPYKIALGDSKTWLLSAGLDYISGSSEVSGLNLKPAMFAITTSENYSMDRVTVMLGMDAGYNVNFTHGHSGLVFTPNIYLDYKVLYMKIGYDYNTFHNQGQFFVRLGVGFGVGGLKMMLNKRH